jgi:ABC-type Fe3+/spermidine/putrescine transport system ATPase subunit
MALLEVRSLKRSFEAGKPAVDDVTFSIEEGEIVCLLGPSGCGKTTLLRMIAGLEPPDGGEVWFAGSDVAPIPAHKRDFGLMFQEFALFPHKNVYDNVAFGLRMHGVSQEDTGQRANEMLDLVDLSGFGERNIDQLSGGEQQRVALARSLAPRPRLLMLDEPLGALDRALRERLMNDLRTILKRVGVTAIYVTHDQTEAFAVSDRIAVMNQGRIEQLAAPEVVYNHPASPFVARFLGFFNLIDGTVAAPDRVQTDIGELCVDQSLPADKTAVTVLIRPDAARQIESGTDEIVNELYVEITAVSFRGKFYQVWTMVNDLALMFEMQDVPESISGQHVRLALNPHAVGVLAA